MPQYLTPGVYVEEVPSAVKPIAGVGTSTAGFIGEVKDGVKMPLQLVPYEPYKIADKDKPYLITNWQEFQNKFGKIGDKNRNLAHAVYGFFNNGGTRCWVIRVDPINGTNVEKALEQFEAIDEIAIVAAPGVTEKDVQEKILSHCENENLQDRFAILDGKQPEAKENPTVKNIGQELRHNTYGAIYFPWITVPDPSDSVGNKTINVPPSGHIAGIYARVDAERGVHKAPANEVIRGALDVQTPVSKEQQAGLNPDGINVIRKFNGNITVWGARTWADPGKESEWKYVNVRRLFLYLRESIDKGTQWVVFEPNEPGLWAKITRNVTAFLTNVWRSGALFGSTPQEAFYVKCDGETNPPELREIGQVVTEIGVAIVKPAEFVVFRISQWAGPGQ